MKTLSGGSQVYYDLKSHIRNLPKGEIMREHKAARLETRKMNAKEESLAPRFEKEINRKRRDLNPRNSVYSLPYQIWILKRTWHMGRLVNCQYIESSRKKIEKVGKDHLEQTMVTNRINLYRGTSTFSVTHF